MSVWLAWKSAAKSNEKNSQSKICNTALNSYVGCPLNSDQEHEQRKCYGYRARYVGVIQQLLEKENRGGGK